MVRVMENYYSHPLQVRATALKATSTAQLCKTIVMENKNFVPDSATSELDITNSRYYCIVIQYEHKLDAEKLRDFVLALKPEGQRLARKRYHFHLGDASYFISIPILLYYLSCFCSCCSCCELNSFKPILSVPFTCQSSS